MARNCGGFGRWDRRSRQCWWRIHHLDRDAVLDRKSYRGADVLLALINGVVHTSRAVFAGGIPNQGNLVVRNVRVPHVSVRCVAKRVAHRFAAAVHPVEDTLLVSDAVAVPNAQWAIRIHVKVGEAVADRVAVRVIVS